RSLPPSLPALRRGRAGLRHDLARRLAPSVGRAAAAPCRAARAPLRAARRAPGAPRRPRGRALGARRRRRRDAAPARGGGAPARERELRRERATKQTEKQASIDELSSSIAHEIRNPIAAAKCLVQQMGEDPTSVENVEYAKVAIEELDRVEHRVSHLLKYAKEEDLSFALVNLATVVDSALTQLRAKLDAAKVAVSRNYIAGPTVQADADKLRGVFVNVIDNAIDALASVPEGRRLDLFLDNGAGAATVRVRDNGCGIPADKLDRIFNPFFTSKEKGTGL